MDARKKELETILRRQMPQNEQTPKAASAIPSPPLYFGSVCSSAEAEERSYSPLRHNISEVCQDMQITARSSLDWGSELIHKNFQVAKRIMVISNRKSNLTSFHKIYSPLLLVVEVMLVAVYLTNSLLKKKRSYPNHFLHEQFFRV